MSTSPYRVCEGANLSLFPRGTKVGDVVQLTKAQALYERDMGRITLVSDEAKIAPADGIVKTPIAGDTLVVAGETKGYPADAVTGDALDLSDADRAAIQAGPDLSTEGTEVAIGQGRAGGVLAVSDSKSRKIR